METLSHKSRFPALLSVTLVLLALGFVLHSIQLLGLQRELRRYEDRTFLTREFGWYEWDLQLTARKGQTLCMGLFSETTKTNNHYTGYGIGDDLKEYPLRVYFNASIAGPGRYMLTASYPSGRPPFTAKWPDGFPSGVIYNPQPMTKGNCTILAEYTAASGEAMFLGYWVESEVTRELQH